MKALRLFVVAAAAATIVVGFIALMNSSTLANQSSERADEMSRATRVDWFEIPAVSDLATWDYGTVGSGKLTFVRSLLNGALQNIKSTETRRQETTSEVTDEETGETTNVTSITYVNVTVWDNRTIRGLEDPTSVVISDDGAHMYTSSAGGTSDSAVTWFTRDPSDGSLVFQSATSAADRFERGLLLSPNQKFLYVLGSTEGSISVFSRDTSTGNITYMETYNDGDTIPGDSSASIGLTDSTAADITTDGTNIYVTSAGGSGDRLVAVYEVNPTSGNLSYVETQTIGGTRRVYAVKASYDGNYVYACGYNARNNNGALNWYSRGDHGALTQFDQLTSTTVYGCSAIDVDQSGEFIYVMSSRNSGTLRVFSVESDGDLSLYQSVTSSSWSVPDLLYVSPDTLYLYVADSTSSVIEAYEINVLTNHPTTSPTFAPTIDNYPLLDSTSYTNTTCSNQTCGQIWPSLDADVTSSRFDSEYICGGSCFSSDDGYCSLGAYGCQGVTLDQYEDPVVSSSSTWYEAVDFCESNGARLCTADEISFGETYGTGCWSEDAYLWSSTSCSVNITVNGTASTTTGYYITASSSRQPVRDSLCRLPSNASETVRVRCCAEITCGSPSLSPTTTPSPTAEISERPTSNPTLQPVPAPTPSPTPEPTTSDFEDRLIFVQTKSVVVSGSDATPMSIVISPDWGYLYMVEQTADSVVTYRRNATTPIPTPVPSPSPTPSPTHPPSHVPTPAPSIVPTPAPTSVPFPAPTGSPTFPPSPAPTGVPTPLPTPTPSTPDPSQKPTHAPTPSPTHFPTQLPTPIPTHVPMPAPSPKPTSEPTHLPTHVPSPVPTHLPTSLPIPKPTPLPTPTPTTPDPSQQPTPVPTAVTQFYIRPVDNSMWCWTLPKADTPSGYRNGLVPTLSRCVNSKSQRWSIDLKRDEIHPQNNFDWCIDSDFDKAVRRPVTLYRCGKTFSEHIDEGHQQWTHSYPSTSTFKNQATDRCIATGKDIYQGRYLQMWYCDGTNQDWEFVPV